MVDSEALHTLALSLGCEPERGCLCAICAESPFDSAGSRKAVFGPGFSYQTDLAAPHASKVCLGCKTVLGGKPGRQPPPLRMLSFVVRGDPPVMETLKQDDWWPLLSDGPQAGMIVSWGWSRKKHHELYAGVSSGVQWRIGSDDGQILAEHEPALMRAILTARAVGATKGAILTGAYGPKIAARSSLQAAEKVIARHRGSSWLELLVYACPGGEEDSEEEIDMLNEHENRAKHLLTEIAWGAGYRRSEGLRFWGGFFTGRIERFAGLENIEEFVSRLGRECRTDVHGMSAAANLTESWTPEESGRVLEAIRRKGLVLQALAFDAVQARRKPIVGSGRNKEESTHG